MVGIYPARLPYPFTVRIASPVPGYVYITAPGCGLNHTKYVISPYITEITFNPMNVTSTNAKDAMGVMFESSVDIAVFLLDRVASARYGLDGFMVVPDDILGQNYVVSSYAPINIYPASPPLITASQHCMIIGTEHNTVVTITFKANLTVEYSSLPVPYRIVSKNENITYTLNYLEVFYIHVYGDISGTLIASNKPVAVISDIPDVVVVPRNTGGQYDQLNTQLLPVDQWSTFYIVPPIFPRSKYMVRVYAYYANTNISLSSEDVNTRSVVLNSGGFKDFELGELPLVAKGNRPFSIFQISYSSTYVPGGNGAMTVVPGMDKFSAGPFIFSTEHRAHFTYNFTNYASIIIEKQFKDKLMYNGTFLRPIHEHTVPAPLDDYVVLTALLKSPATVHIFSTGSTMARFAVLVYGISQSLQYGYLAGMDFLKTGSFNFMVLYTH